GAAAADPPHRQPPVADDFDDGAIDHAKWNRLQYGTGSVAETGGVLLTDVESRRAASGLTLQCHWDSDFDVSVDYELLDVPEPNDFHVAITATGARFAAIERRTSSTCPDCEEYVSSLGGAIASAATADRAGSLRMTRSGDRVTTYIRSGS